MQVLKTSTFARTIVYNQQEYVCQPCTNIDKAGEEKQNQGHEVLKVRVESPVTLSTQGNSLALFQQSYKTTEFLFISKTK